MGSSSIPPDRFYGGREAPPPTPPPADGFWRAAPPPKERTLERWAARPLRMGAILVLVGFAGVFLVPAELEIQIVVGAPVFEEMWKLGGALLLVGLTRARPGVLRVALGLLPGVGFGVMEHYVTYWEEDLLSYANRVVFHSGASALSTSVWHALEPVGDVRVRWASTVPATVLHWANNFGAVVLSVASVLLGDLALVAGLAFSLAIGVFAHLGAWGMLFAGRRVRGWILRLWAEHAPGELR